MKYKAIRAARVSKRFARWEEPLPHGRGSDRVAAPMTAQRGFTLLEVLVATAILGTAVAALMGTLSGALRNSERLEGPAQALLLGQSKMNELLVSGTAVGEGSMAEMPLDQQFRGEWDDRFRWEAMATRFRSSPERIPGETILVRIALDVFWKTGRGDQERKLSFESYQLRKEPPVNLSGVVAL